MLIRPVWRNPVKVSLSNGGYTLYSVPPPGSGLLLGFILNILDDYKLSPESLRGNEANVTYQRIIEAFKHAYARRTEMGDEDFEDMRLVRNTPAQLKILHSLDTFLVSSIFYLSLFLPFLSMRYLMSPPPPGGSI